MFFRLRKFCKKNALLQKKALSLLPQVNGNLYDIIPGKKRRGREKQSEIEYIRCHSGAIYYSTTDSWVSLWLSRLLM